MATKKYTINWTDETLKKPFTVTSKTTDATSSSLTLIGSGSMEWGKEYQENLLHLLENFASNAKPPKNPTIGQMWFNTAENRLKIYSKDGKWVDLKNRRIDSPLPPVGKFIPGDLWFDSGKGQLKVYLNEGVWSDPMSGSAVIPRPIPVPTPAVTPTPARPVTPTPLPPGVPTPTLTPGTTPSPFVPTPVPTTYTMPAHSVEYYGPEFVWGLDGGSGSAKSRVAQPVPQLLQIALPQLNVSNKGVNNNTITKLLNGTDGVNLDWENVMSSSTAKVIVISSFGYRESVADLASLTQAQWQESLTKAGQIAQKYNKLVVYVSMHKIDPAIGNMVPFADTMKTVAASLNAGFIDMSALTASTFVHSTVTPTPVAPPTAPGLPRFVPTVTDYPETILPTPTINTGESVQLERGTVYMGTLNLNGKSNITINVKGYGAAPIITPGEAVAGFTQYSGSIYRAPLVTTPKQVLVNMIPVNPATWPSNATYATGNASGNTITSTTVLPNPPQGARCVFRTHTWNLESRQVISGDNNSFTLGDNIDEDMYRGYALPAGSVSFYLEGKLWMLNGANQWAYDNGYLYIWSKDGTNPNGKVWVNYGDTGIDAQNSTNVKINNLKVVGSHIGVDGRGSTGLVLTGCEIHCSSKTGFFLNGANGAQFISGAVQYAKYSGIDARWDESNITVKQSTIKQIGTYLAKPDHIQGAINSPLGLNYSVTDNDIIDVGYIGIRVYKSATVKDNLVDGWCKYMQDGGGIYVNAPESGIDMNTTIQGNRVRNGENGPANFSIYLDDNSRKVNVWDNIVESSNKCTAFFLHNAMNCDIRRNQFRMNATTDNNMIVGFMDNSNAPFTGNVFSENLIVAPNGIRPVYMVGESMTTSMITFSDNDWYTQDSFANLEGTGTLTWTQWKTRFVETGSTWALPSAAPAETVVAPPTAPAVNPIHEWLPDGVTPNQKGYNVIAQNLAQQYPIEYKKLTSVDTTPPTTNPKPYGQDASLYPTMTFQEEFDGTQLNASKWKMGNWYETWVNLNNWSVENGALTVWSKPSSNGSWEAHNFTMTTDTTFYQRYGYFEIEAKLPYGSSLWPAFWMYSHDDSTRPVVDFMETWPSIAGYGDANMHPRNYVATVTAPNQTKIGERKLLGSLYNDINTAPDLSTAFHRYGCRWDSSGVQFFFDGQAIGSKITTNGMTKRMFLVIDLWLGGLAGAPDGNTPTTKDRGMVINYIRCWALNDGTTEISGSLITGSVPTPGVVPTPATPTPTVPVPAVPTPTTPPTAPAPLNATDLKVTTLVTGLPKPWAIAFISSTKVLVTEKPTSIMRVCDLSTGAKGPSISGLPAILPTSIAKHGGLLDVIVDSQFASNRIIYFSYTAGTASANAITVSKARLSNDETALENVQQIFQANPLIDSGDQPGGRICEWTDGTLFITCGDRYKADNQARTLTNNFGKIVRINKDGTVPANNPYANASNAAQRFVYSYGHRNPLGAAIGPDGRLWMHENMAEGGDEVNIIKPGLDYGWPNQSYGSHYDDGHSPKEIPDTIPGVELPIHWWNPSIAPSGMTFISSDKYGPAWKGNLMLGALAGTSVRRLVVHGSLNDISSETKYLASFGKRIRDVRQGPDGFLYGCTDEDAGVIFRIDPVFPSVPTPTPGVTPTPTVPGGSGIQPFGQSGSYTLTFQDEFDGNALNFSKWNDAIWYETSDPTINYAVQNGSLNIWPAAGFVNRTIDTDGKHEQLYGFFEMEAKLPYGKGVWPAFWLYAHPGDERLEIDIMEAYPGGGPSSGWGDSNLRPINYGVTIHKANADYTQHDVPYGKTLANFGMSGIDLSAAFHKYGVKWESTGVTFYFDGQPLGSKWIDSAGILNKPMYILVDLWFGDASGTPDASTPRGQTNSYEIRYVRAWSFGGSTTPTPAVPSPTVPTPVSPSPGVFSAQLSQAPSNGATLSGNVTFTVTGGLLQNVELLPASGYSPMYGRFTINSNGTQATLTLNTSQLANGAYDMRIAAFNVPAGNPGGVEDVQEITAMSTRRFTISNGSSVPTPTVPASSIIVDYYGDSTIWGVNGQGGGRVAQPAPQVFAAQTGYTTRNEGVSGTTTSQLLNGSDGVHPAWTTQMANTSATWVFINHGINDWQLDVSGYKANLQQLVTVARNAGKKVVLETPNPTYQILSGGSAGSDAEVANKAQYMREVGFAMNVPVIDQHKMLTDYASANGLSIQSMIPDGLHPNQATYTRKGQYAATEFARILGSSPPTTTTPTPVVPNAAAPAVASARGYTKRVFFDDFNNPATIGTSGPWYVQRPFGYPNVPSDAYSVSGSVLHYTNGDGYSNLGISTVGPGGSGFVKRNGGYFEARIRILGRGRSSGWTAFWTMAVEHLYGPDNEYIEVDFLEDLAGAYGWPSNTIAQVVHNWVGNSTTSSDGHQVPLNNFNFSDWHTYGTLWVPAASNGGSGYIAFFVDGRETARTNYGTSGPYSVGDRNGWPVILGTGPGAGFECDWVAVWGT